MPPHSIQEGVERLNTSFGQESAVTAKVVALPEESREPESEIVQFFAGTCCVKRMNYSAFGYQALIYRDQLKSWYLVG